MLFFSIVSLSFEECFEECCNDIATQVKNGIATMPLFCATLVPEGTPTIDKPGMCCSKYRKYK